MKTASALIALLVIAGLASISSAAPQSAPRHVLEVIVLDPGANVQQLTQLIDRATAITSKVPAYKGKVRTWMTAWAGSETGKVVVTVEFPSLADLATASDALNGSADWQKWQADFQASGIKVLSESLSTELHAQQ